MSPTDHSAPRRPLMPFEAAAAGLLCLAALGATSPMLPITWDEGNAILRSDRIIEWSERAFDRSTIDGVSPWSAEGIARGWPFTTQIEGHPPFYAVIISMGRALVGRWITPLGAARFGPICLFALAAAAMYYRLSRQYGRPAAIGAVLALLGLPRLFAHAHLASFDGPMVACWVLAWALFEPACRRKRWITPWAVALGATLASKFTGWFSPVPFLVWAVAYRDRGAIRALLLGLPIALTTFFVLNPPLWPAPIDGLREFFFLNITRGKFNISILFLGRMYNLDHPLPWWNTAFWTAITVPLGFLILFAAGLLRIGRSWRREPQGTLLLAHWGVLMVVRALPAAPPHDAIRLFLPSFAFLAAIVGLGFHTLWQGTSQRVTIARSNTFATIARRAAACLFVAGSLTSVVWYAPHWLSHYNVLIGGVRGATRRGMETTYYWDGLDREVLEWLTSNTASDERVVFAAPSGENLYLLAKWGHLRFRFHPKQGGKPRWYVVQHRPSAWSYVDRHLLTHGRPAFVKTLGRAGAGPWRTDIPLVTVYPYAEYEWSYRAVRSMKTPPPLPPSGPCRTQPLDSVGRGDM